MSCPCNPRTGKCFDPDEEGPSAADLERFGGDGVACPECGAEVFHDAALCPECGHAMTDASLFKGKAWVGPVTWAAVLALVAAAVMWALWTT